LQLIGLLWRNQLNVAIIEKRGRKVGKCGKNVETKEKSKNQRKNKGREFWGHFRLWIVGEFLRYRR
jgi:hypothetical protein